MASAIRTLTLEGLNIKGLNYWKARNGLLESIIKIALYIDDLTLLLKDEQDMQQAL